MTLLGKVKLKVEDFFKFCALRRTSKLYLPYFRYGALDAKMASKYSFPGLNFTAVAGPTHDQHPPFSWSKTSIPDEKPTFLPIDTFDFEPFDHTWVMNGQEPK